MKKLLYVLMAVSLLASKCKKTEPLEEEQTFECLPKQLDYVDANDPNGNESIQYFYDENRIKYKDRSFADGTIYRYNYYYTDKNKGLLERIDIVINGQVLAKILYTTDNDEITERKLVVLANDNTTWLDAWKFTYTYTNGKVTQVRIEDYDLWNQGQNPTDKTGVYTYTGDNLTNSKWYDTNDMNTLKEEYTYEYDSGKRPFDNVITQTFPQVRVNNVTRMTHSTYGNNPGTEVEVTDINYNSKNFPEEFVTTDDRGNSLNSLTVTYDNCQ
jgi:hypothetical protein